MQRSLSILMEESIQIAWEYLERTGQIEDGAEASRFLSEYVELMIRRGTISRLILSNKAISAYMKYKGPDAPPPSAKRPTTIVLV